MLNQGFVFSILPAIKTIYRDKEKLINNLLKHLEFFNTHPFLSPYIIGSVVRIEEDKSSNNINDFKIKLGNFLASFGDRLFWKYLKPFSVLTGLAIILMFRAFFPYNILIGLLLFLVLFNVPVFIIRYKGLTNGYKYGKNITQHIPVYIINKLNKNLAIAGLIILGIIFIVEIKVFMDYNLKKISIFGFSALISFFLNYRKTLINFSLIIPLLLTIIIVFLINTFFNLKI